MTATAIRAKHFLSISDLEDDTMMRLVDDSISVAQGAWDRSRPMTGKFAGIYFRKTSTRTRTSFTVGAQKLGASVIAYGPADMQLVTGESVSDTAQVLANCLDVLVIRTNESIDEMRQFAAQTSMAIINAMSDNEHPTQAIADLSAIKEAFGVLRGVHVLYIGEGNNTAAALALALAKTPGARLTLVTPPGEGLPKAVLEYVRTLASTRQSVVEQLHDLDSVPTGVDVVYTTRWVTMGVAKSDPNWIEKYRPYAVNEQLMARVSKEHTVFMHDLPAMREQEVTTGVLDGVRSIVVRQAYHKLTSAMAILSWCTE